MCLEGVGVSAVGAPKELAWVTNTLELWVSHEVAKVMHEDTRFRYTA